MPTTISTSFITGTGEKKCRPRTRSGFCVHEASCAIGIDEVLEARIVVLGQLVELLEQRALDARILEDGLDDELGAGERVERFRPADAADQLGALGLGELAAGDGAGDRGVDHVATALQRRALGLMDDDVEATACRRFGDAGAHEAGAHDADEVDRCAHEVVRSEK